MNPQQMGNPNQMQQQMMMQQQPMGQQGMTLEQQQMHQQQQMQQHHQHMQQQQAQAQQPEPKPDNITKVRQLYLQLVEVMNQGFRNSGMAISLNSHIDSGNKSVPEMNPTKLEESLEKFYSVCDQMELHLKTAIDHNSQAALAQRYTPNALSPIGGDYQKYGQYISSVKSQVSYVKDVHSSVVGIANAGSLSSGGRPSSDTIASMESSN